MDDEAIDEIHGALYLISTELFFFSIPVLLTMVSIPMITHRHSPRFTITMCVAVCLAWYPVGQGGVFYEDMDEEDEEDDEDEEEDGKTRAFYALPRAVFRRYNVRGELIETEFERADDGDGNEENNSGEDGDEEGQLTDATDEKSGLRQLATAGLFVSAAAVLTWITSA